MPKRFVTKRVEIDAIQWTGDNAEGVIEFTEELFKPYSVNLSGFDAKVYDKLHDTWIQVRTGQWIVRGAKGEYYPCDNETFLWKYEEL